MPHQYVVVDLDTLPNSSALTVPQTAGVLNVAEVTVWRWLREGRIKSFKISCSRRIRVGDLKGVMGVAA
jgi:hypothetical protein